MRLKSTGKLQREINQALITQNPDIVFLNRNIVTNHFMHKQNNKDITVNQTLDKIHNVSRGLGPVMPDLTIILHTQNLQMFLKRAKRTNDDGFRTNLLKKHFSLYGHVLKDLDEVAFPYALVEADQSIESINEEIMTIIKVKINEKKNNFQTPHFI